MRVHPVPDGNFVIGCGAGAQRLAASGVRKGLKRLPHVFNSVLQLPVPSDAHVAVEEAADCFRFVAGVPGGIRAVTARMREIHPGLVKVLIREATDVESDDLELELDVWRSRLPASTRPELATASCVGGELVVTVPKEVGLGMENGVDVEHGDGGGFHGMGRERLIGDLGRLVLAQ